MQTIDFKGRVFQLWEYQVSHGSLLIRSPKGPTFQTNIDIICAGVEYLAAPRFLRGLEIQEANALELQHVESVLGRHISSSNLRMLVANDIRFPIVAASFKVEEHEQDIFSSPFDLKG